jgi:hypothetical protein
LPGAGQGVTFHFKNRPDNTVEATVAGPSLRGNTQNFVRVMQKGVEVELTLFVFGGSYKGILNSEGTEITGAWTQNPGAPALPLIMRKK